MSFQSSKKRNTQASLIPNKYSGPVRNNFTSVHAKLAILRSSFKPQGGWNVGKTLIDSHMEAHKKRVETAKACVDTSTPKAMVESTKGKQVWVDGILRSRTVTGRTGQPLQSSRKPGKVVHFREHLLDFSLSSTSEGDEERIEDSNISPGSEAEDDDSMSTGADKSEAIVPGKTQNTYLTRTARLSAAYKERQSSKQCECKVANAHSSLPPWRPVYPEQAHFKHYPGISLSSLHSIDQDNLFTPKKQTVHRTAAKIGATATGSPNGQQERGNSSERCSALADKGSRCVAHSQEDFNRTFLVEGEGPAGCSTQPEEMTEHSELGVDSSSGTPPYVEDFEEESGADEGLDSYSDSQSKVDSPPSPTLPVIATPIQHAHLKFSSAGGCTNGAVNDAAKDSDVKASEMTIGGIMTSSTSGVTTSDVTASDVTAIDMTTSGVMGNDAANNAMKSTGVMKGDVMCSRGMSNTGSAPIKRLLRPPRPRIRELTSFVYSSPGPISRESDYLAFTARVTQDILARGVYTDVGLKLLFEEHTERNRELLDMNEMQKRIQLLTESLNIS